MSVVNFPRKNQENFSVTLHFKLPKILRNPYGMHFLAPCTVPFKLSGATLFSFFYKGFEQNAQKKMIPEKIADFIIAVTGNRIEEELGGVGTYPVLRV